jgi:hypothetical protein
LEGAVGIFFTAEYFGHDSSDRHIFSVPDIQNPIFAVRAEGPLDRAGWNGDNTFLPIDRE